MTNPSHEFSYQKGGSYLTSRLVEQLQEEWAADTDRTTVSSLREYLGRLSETPGFARVWEGIIAHGGQVYKMTEPFNINAFLCGALTGLKTVEAADTWEFMEKMDTYLVSHCVLTHKGLMPIKEQSTAESRRGWAECEKAFREDQSAAQALACVMDECQLVSSEESQKFKAGIGLVIAGHSVGFAQMYDTGSEIDRFELDLELKELLSKQNPSEE